MLLEQLMPKNATREKATTFQRLNEPATPSGNELIVPCIKRACGFVLDCTGIPRGVSSGNPVVSLRPGYRSMAGQTTVSEEEPWSRRDSNRLTTLVVVVIAVGGVVAFLIWLNHFLKGIGF